MRQKSANRRFWLLVLCLLAALLLLNLPEPASALSRLLDATPTPVALFEDEARTSASLDVLSGEDGFFGTLTIVGPVMLLAAVLGGLVAYHRRLTVFERDLFQAHILLSVAGALMMLIVGNELVRAFGLLGAASVVRYRYKLRNPRDASMLIIALGVGMAAGAGLYALAVSAAVVVALFSQGLDRLIARAGSLIRVVRPTTLKIRTTQPEVTLARVNRLFEQHAIESRLQGYRLLPKEVVDGLPVYRLTYRLRLAAEDTRFQYTAQLTDKAIVGLEWETDNSKKH